MASKEVGLHEDALAEAQAAYDWYAEAGSSYLSGTRRFVMRRFPFTVIYRDREKLIEVVAVAHGRRKPGYWKKRIKN